MQCVEIGISGVAGRRGCREQRHVVPVLSNAPPGSDCTLTAIKSPSVRMDREGSAPSAALRTAPPAVESGNAARVLDRMSTSHRVGSTCSSVYAEISFSRSASNCSTTHGPARLAGERQADGCPPDSRLGVYAWHAGTRCTCTMRPTTTCPTAAM